MSENERGTNMLILDLEQVSNYVYISVLDEPPVVWLCRTWVRSVLGENALPLPCRIRLSISRKPVTGSKCFWASFSYSTIGDSLLPTLFWGRKKDKCHSIFYCSFARRLIAHFGLMVGKTYRGYVKVEILDPAK